MKTLFVLLASLLLVVAFIGCGAKEQSDDTGAAGHPEEMADSTRMDSAMNDMMDSANQMMDSAQQMMEDAADEAMDEAGDAVKEATGH